MGKIEEALTLMKFDGELPLIYVLSGSCNRNYVFTLIEMICPKSWAKPLLKNPLQVDFRLSSIMTLLLDIGLNSANYF